MSLTRPPALRSINLRAAGAGTLADRAGPPRALDLTARGAPGAGLPACDSQIETCVACGAHGRCGPNGACECAPDWVGERCEHGLLAHTHFLPPAPPGASAAGACRRAVAWAAWEATTARIVTAVASLQVFPQCSRGKGSPPVKRLEAAQSLVRYRTRRGYDREGGGGVARWDAAVVASRASQQGAC